MASLDERYVLGDNIGSMKAKIKVKGALHLYLYALLYITILLAVVAIVIAFFPQYAGVSIGASAIISFIMCSNAQTVVTLS